MPVIAASYLGPSLTPNLDIAWDEAKLPLNPDEMVQKIIGQPLRRAGRFIKMVCCGAMACLQSAPPDELKGKKTGIFLATGLGNIDEILPFITQVFKYEGGFPSPNQFANSVSNAAAFFLSKVCDVNGVILTISQEELSFESALWLAQSYLQSGEIDLALVGGCDVFTPTVDDYHERMDLKPGNYRSAPMGEGSSWLLLGQGSGKKIGDILSVEFPDKKITPDKFSDNSKTLDACEKILLPNSFNPDVSHGNTNRHLIAGFRLPGIDQELWKANGWTIEDYLPYCGIHPTAAAFGLARALLTKPAAVFVHYNCHTSGKQALIAAVTK